LADNSVFRNNLIEYYHQQSDSQLQKLNWKKVFLISLYLWHDIKNFLLSLLQYRICRIVLPYLCMSHLFTCKSIQVNTFILTIRVILHAKIGRHEHPQKHPKVTRCCDTPFVSYYTAVTEASDYSNKQMKHDDRQHFCESKHKHICFVGVFTQTILKTCYNNGQKERLCLIIDKCRRQKLCKRAQKISVAAPLCVMASRYNPCE
jgi:hypothetical protein